MDPSNDKIAHHQQFAALGNPLRLKVFRKVIAAGVSGLSAGDISRQLQVPASTLSAHLKTLEGADLLQHRRQRQSLIYTVNPAAVQALVAYLVEDCCGGRPELCGLDLQ